MHRLLIEAAFPVVERGLSAHGLQQSQLMGSIVVAHGLSCPVAWGGSSQTRDRTHVPCIGRWILNHRTTEKSEMVTFLKEMFLPEKNG